MTDWKENQNLSKQREYLRSLLNQKVIVENGPYFNSIKVKVADGEKRMFHIGILTEVGEGTFTLSNRKTYLIHQVVI